MSLRERMKELKLGMSRKAVSLSPYTPNWSKAFSAAETLLRERIPSGLDLHHIGSTSIPNIHAKPILDLLGVVPSIEAFDSRRADLEALGFVWKGEYGIANRRYCVLYDENEEFGLIHFHVFAKVDHQVAKHLVFRDYLRASSEAAGRYEELKMRLAEAHADARTNYSEGKSELIAQLLSEAFEWRKGKIAYHETGHAVMAMICGQGVKKVSLREMDSPRGTGKYLGATLLEPFEQTPTITVNESNRRIMISLAGFAGDGLFSEGLISNFAGDDLMQAIRLVENMLENEMFRTFVVQLPAPESGTLDLIENSLVKQYIDYMMKKCFEALEPLKPVIQVIAEELYRKEELTGDEVFALFNSLMGSSQDDIE